MKKLFFLPLLFLFSGCLVVEKVHYRIVMDNEMKGNVEVTFYNIRSDAIGNKEFQEDKKNLFEYALNSSEFISEMAGEGKHITSRKLFEKEGKLNGVMNYNFDDISRVEGIRFQDGFYFLTMQVEDSIVTTNGEVVKTDEYKRIMWKAETKEMIFEILSGNTPAKARDLLSEARKYLSK